MRREALCKEMYPRKGEVGVFDDFYVYALLDKEYEAIHSSGMKYTHTPVQKELIRCSEN
jgi:hypothetical protein